MVPCPPKVPPGMTTTEGDVSKASTDQVTLGSRATLTNLETGQQEVYSLLGPWDGVSEKGNGVLHASHSKFL